MSLIIFVFFFSSRRRHTRCGRDWSSDVCSSDLHRLGEDGVGAGLPGARDVGFAVARDDDDAGGRARGAPDLPDQGVTRDIRQPKIAQDDVKTSIFSELGPLFSAARRDDIGALRTEENREDFADIRDILDEEYVHADEFHVAVTLMYDWIVSK